MKPKPEALSKSLTTDDIDVDDVTGEIVDKKKKNIYQAPKLTSALMPVLAFDMYKLNRKISKTKKLREKSREKEES